MAMVQRHSDPSASVEEIAELRRNGLEPEQCRRLIAVRERVRDGGYGDDRPGDTTGEAAFARRLAFARWLVQRGLLGEFGVRTGGA